MFSTRRTTVRLDRETFSKSSFLSRQSIAAKSIKHSLIKRWELNHYTKASIHWAFNLNNKYRVPLSSVCYFAHLNLFFLLASLRHGFFFATLPRRPASRSSLFTVDVETGVLRVLLNEAASWGLVRRLLLKLDTNVLVLLLSYAPGHPTLSILVRASMHCSVKGVAHSAVQDLQFLGIFSHGIAFISQNKHRLTRFRRKSGERSLFLTILSL